jgi:hypothetical protein
MGSADETMFENGYPVPQDPVHNAWYTAFFIENHIDHIAYKDVAAPEQIRFMVVLAPEQRYYPCSDKMFSAIMARQKPSFLLRRYDQALEKILALIEAKIEDPWEREFLESLIRTKFEHETRDGMMIPSRLEKRLLKIFLDRTQIVDPLMDEKAVRNLRVRRLLESQSFSTALNRFEMDSSCPAPHTLESIRASANNTQLTRLLALLSAPALWEQDRDFSVEELEQIMARPLGGEGLDEFMRLLTPERCDFGLYTVNPIKVLWLIDESGEALIDLYIIRFLAGMGHKMMVCFKKGPLYTKADFADTKEDPSLAAILAGARFVQDAAIAKNDLVALLKKDIHILAFTDGSMEDINLSVATTTFSRFFKEADLVVARGPAQRRRFFETSFRFTRDIISIMRDEDISVSVAYKPKHPDAVKFSHHELEKRAAAIIGQMNDAKKKGMTVVFYSGIVGSIPGKTQVAKQIMTTFVNHLRQQSDDTFIINPSEYFEQGMDADDLMYMWEMVQRSGLIDIWRFQTYEDIVASFALLNKKVPPEWVGKDSTFSTGCTKEMRIAREVAAQNPEMQIIGPPEAKFYRRGEYGVGSFYDTRLSQGG